jgi:hypothetical protein
MDEARTRAPDEPGAGRKTAQAAGQAATDAAGNVADTAKEQAREVTGEVRYQARSVAEDVRDRVTEQAQSQNDRLADSMRRLADELDDMAADRKDSPARTVVSRVADGSRQMADYLAERGPQGVLEEVQDFARRRPGAFLFTAVAAGFVVGRLGKGVLNATGGSTATGPDRDAYATPSLRSPVSTVPGVPFSGTEYAATGTGTPVAVEDEFVPPANLPPAGDLPR